MATPADANLTPSTWLGAGYSADSSDHTITFGIAGNATGVVFPAITDAEAVPADTGGTAEAPTTAGGDIRKVLFGLLDGLYEKWLLRVAAAAAAPTTAPLPTKFTMYKSTSTNDTTGEVTRTYSVQVKTTVTGEEVAAEA